MSVAAGRCAVLSRFLQAECAVPTDDDGLKANPDANKAEEPDGKENYVYCETRGRGT